jgi:hypothetical protein
MDLYQRKLTKAEWLTMEKPVSPQEQKILELIIDGYSDIHIRNNENKAFFTFMKMEKSPEMEFYIYKKYFEELVSQIIGKYAKNTQIEENYNELLKRNGELKTMRSSDMIRIHNLDTNIKQNREHIFEYILLKLAHDLLKNLHGGKKDFAFYFYTIIQLKKSSIPHLNTHLVGIIDTMMEYIRQKTTIRDIISNAYQFIENNKYLLKYEDKVLFSHQKELFSIFSKKNQDQNPNVANLVLYMAPTGTGKTLSPIGLSQTYRIIFVCVARHIGLALAKSAISIEKKVAFAFGCETATDIRLHYFSALNYTKNKRSGGIGKVDNSIGDNVEIMICDVQSYLTAMYYMLAFNPATNIITYWDEPTITMDYLDHPLHPIIHRNWCENKIPNMVLSCATLPMEAEIYPIFDDFRGKFTEQYDEVKIHIIKSFDSKKSIPIINKNGYCVLPHYLYPDWQEVKTCSHYCLENKTLLRYFDLREIIRFIEYCNSHEGVIEEVYSIDSYFERIEDITMNSLKEYYLVLLSNNRQEKWQEIYTHFIETRKRKYDDDDLVLRKTKSLDSGSGSKQKHKTNKIEKIEPIFQRSQSIAAAVVANPIHKPNTGILLTTSDAYTLTDGPTLFLAEDTQKIGTFYIQQSEIPTSIFQHIMSKITKNTDIIKEIENLDALIVAKEEKSSGSGVGGNTTAKEKEKSKNTDKLSKESYQWMTQINKLRKEIQLVSLDPLYVPNTRPHQMKWTPTNEVYEDPFISNIGEDMAEQIMLLNIENHLKVLLLLGIGVFMENMDSVGTMTTAKKEYIEIMKKLADEQHLFLIIASSDYIYGTNYQFCHGIIGKDLKLMTQQKTLQAMGRIGRNHIQQDYTIRFRDDAMIYTIFQKQEENLEADNICRLFSSDISL